MKVLVTGGCGYKGSVLVPKLLAKGHRVTVLDTQWFGNYLEPHPALDFCCDDIRAIAGSVWEQFGGLREYDAIIHLAGIANDPCGELDAKLTWEVNVLATARLADAAARAGVARFIFASSASIYGIKGNQAVDEDTEFAPVSDYNKTKMVAERVLLSHNDKMAIQLVRPATVCGYSPRMRLDTVVNMLTTQAIRTGEIVAHCGAHGAELMRPNVHIEDITDLYCWLLEQPAQTGVWNAGFENLSVYEIAQMIQRQVPSKLNITEVTDKRSYLVDSSRILKAGFAPRFKVEDAIRDIREAWAKNKIPTDTRTINLVWMREKGLVRDAR